MGVPNPEPVEEVEPPTVLEEVPEGTDTIAMDEIDIRTGVLLEIEAARAQSRAQAMMDAASLFHDQMRVKYKVSENHKMSDWLTGFQVQGG